MGSLSLFKDWTGNTTSIFATLAASNHSGDNRALDDYYCTPPEAVEAVLERETFSYYILEPAVGGGYDCGCVRETRPSGAIN